MYSIPHIILHASTGFSTVQIGNLPQGSSAPYVLIFIAVILTLRVYRGLSGRVYSTARVLRPPVVYLVLTVIAILGLGYMDNSVFLTFIFIPLGFLISYRLLTDADFFARNGTVYYKRSPFILVFWVVSFLSRMILEYFFPTNLEVLMVIDSVLSFTTGLIIGESLHLISERKKFVPDAASPEGIPAQTETQQ